MVHAASKRTPSLCLPADLDKNCSANEESLALTCFEVRPPCPKCGMNMVKMDARLECLRCGHVEKPSTLKPVTQPTA